MQKERMSWWDEFEDWRIFIPHITIDDHYIDKKFESIQELWTFLQGYFYGRSKSKK